MFVYLFKDSGLHSLIGNQNVNFGTLKTLTRLEIDGSRCDNKIVADILTQCTSLTHLNIGYCLGLGDEMFSLNSHINAPLEELNMAFQKQVSTNHFYFKFFKIKSRNLDFFFGLSRFPTRVWKSFLMNYGV